MSDVPDDFPTAGLPEASTSPHGRPRRRPTVIAAGVAAVVALAAGSIIIIGARNDATPSIQVSTAVDGSPITAADADVDVYIDDDTIDADLVEVRSFLDSDAHVIAYTYVTTDQALSEREVLERCAPGVVGAFGGPVFRVRLDDAAAREPLAEQLASMRAVTRVLINPATAPVSAATALPTTTTAAAVTTALPATTTLLTTASPASTTVATSTTLPVSTTAVTSTPTATEPPSSSTPPSSASVATKEIPFSLPAPSGCPPPPGSTPPRSTPAPTVLGRPPVAADATLPPAGEEPSDPASAEQSIREMWLYTHDGSIPLEDRFRDHLEDADVLLPLMKSIGQDSAVQTTQILGVQFVSPTRAGVLSRNVFRGGSLDVAQLQYVVLIDGQWKWTRESQCAAIARAGVHCPEGP